MTSDFAWLQAIVEEETGNISAINEDEIDAEPARPSLRRFIFSKLPVWLQGDSATSVAEAEAVTDVPDYLADFDDFDEPADFDDFNDDFDDFEFDDDFDD
jgi:hypothetical protein